MISAKVVAHSVHPITGKEICSMLVTMPRIILAEFNTHRMFSRNSASSRAIPFEKMLKSVQENPFIPIAWMKDHRGMQGAEYFTDYETIERNNQDWLYARDEAVVTAKTISLTGVTKQFCNRLLEPFMWHTVIVTSTEWENFFYLRCPQYEFDGKFFRSRKDALPTINSVLGESDFNDTSNYLQWASINKGQAEIHMMQLAECIWDAKNESIPRVLEPGEWHIPFGDKMVQPFLKTSGDDVNGKISWIPLIGVDNGAYEWVNLQKVKVSTAMAARTSYTVVGSEDRNQNYIKDMELHDQLAKSGHWSPFEHCAQAVEPTEVKPSNFLGGWLQYRKLFAKENKI